MRVCVHVHACTYVLKYACACVRSQTRIVEAGALKPLVAMMSVHAEPRHYAGLALLKLADNFENHIAIAEEGGIQVHIPVPLSFCLAVSLSSCLPAW